MVKLENTFSGQAQTYAVNQKSDGQSETFKGNTSSPFIYLGPTGRKPMYSALWKVYQMYTLLLRSRHVERAYILEQGGILL